MAEQLTDITRLKACRLGVRDFIEKPFTDEELCIRLRRLARPPERPEPERVVFKGNIAQGETPSRPSSPLDPGFLA